MKSNRLTNILLVAVLAVLLSGRLPAVSPTPVQPAAAAPAAPSGYIPQAPIISGYVSVPAAAFHPMGSSESYYNYGTDLSPQNASSANYIAEVYLPDGATIDSLSCLMRDYLPSSQGSCTLIYQTISGSNLGSPGIMGAASTDHSTTAWETYTTGSISYAQVDNSLRAYSILIYLPYDDVSHYITFGGARIHYYYSTVYLPSVSK